MCGNSRLRIMPALISHLYPGLPGIPVAPFVPSNAFTLASIDLSL